MTEAEKAPKDRKASILFFILLLYAGCFILYYALTYAFYALIAGPDVFGPAPVCAPLPPGSKGGLCPTLVALHDKFASPWFYGGLVVTVVILVVWRMRARKAI